MRITYPDGHELSSENAPWATAKENEPYLGFVSGQGTGGGWREIWWLTPLPSTGVLTFECDWPEAGVRGDPVAVALKDFDEARERAVDL